MKTLNTTRKDYDALRIVEIQINLMVAEESKIVTDYIAKGVFLANVTASKWISVYSLVKRSKSFGLTHSRVDRLIGLGLIASRMNGGFSMEVAIKK